MKKTICAAVALVSILAASAQAHMATLYSKNFYGDSSGLYVSPTCQMIPRNCNVGLDGTDSLPVLVNPWESVPIDIRCVQIIFAPSTAMPSSAYVFAGNSSTPDVMLWAVPQPNGGAEGHMCYPEGTAMPFPAATSPAASNGPGQNNFALPHLDVHVYGYAPGASYQVYLTVWYTRDDQ
jgi:hypothetical protein